MQAFRATLNLQSAFATPIKGDTLFGQLCWAIRNRFGESKLAECLEGYTDSRPFTVLSDAFPQGYLPLPKLPAGYYDKIEGGERKSVKKRCWLPETAIAEPMNQWLGHAIEAKTVAERACKNKGSGSDASSRFKNFSLSEKHPQPHNTINRQTNTTGEGFAPYSIEQESFAPGVAWMVYLVLDSHRFSQEDCRQCLIDIGNIGFGRDASTGLSKFAIGKFDEVELPKQDNANACLTLAPCAPQGLGFDGQNSFYQLFTRFGRHGDIAVHSHGKPFKNPILMAQTAAVFSTTPPQTAYIGQGIGGNGQLSTTLPETVHQGYAPVIWVRLARRDTLSRSNNP